MAKADDSNLSLVELVQQKEKEWKEAQELRVQSMELSLKEHEKLLNNERIRFRKLKEDFEYNLKLLADRDQELERYDLLFSKYKNLEGERDGEVSELKIKLDDLKSRLMEEENSREELQKYYQQVSLQSSAEEDMERQRHMLMSGYDDELHKRAHEYRLRTDEMSNRLLESDLKAKMLSKEVEILRSYEERTKTDLQATETNVEELEKKLKQKEWELMDSENMHNAKLADMELEIEKLKAAMKKSQGIYQHKQAGLDRYVREKESTLLASKEAHQQRERQLEEIIRELQNKLDTIEVECRRLEWESRDVEKDKQFQLDKLQKTVADVEQKLSLQATKFSQSSVSKNLELQALHQQEEKLRMDVIQRTADLERYKRDLSMATERESNHERIKAQMGLDWQRRCEDAEREAYDKQEELLRHLTKAKDEAVATVKEKERELNQRENLIRILTQTRDQAIATLQRHGLSVPMQLPSKEEPGCELDSSENLSSEEKIKMFQEQNQSLRDVIRQMRQEMEELNNQLASRPPSVMVPTVDEDPNHSNIPLTSEYVKSLEKDIRDLKAKTDL
ncbi:hypothetical protein QZH41_011625 [Actinostola sp. cb2023]|nr:hypothetical protein QZH41_011625 [Actinostola sp. cb2023]